MELWSTTASRNARAEWRAGVLQSVLNSGSMRLSALAYPLLVSLVAQLVCAMSFESADDLGRSRHLRIELYTGPCGS